MSASLTKLLLVRHGVTSWNRERRFQGHVDIPLNDEGHLQARRTAQRLAGTAEGSSISAVYSSDLARASQTAEPIAQALGLALSSEPGLRERSYGAFEGLTHVEIERDQHDAWRRWQQREPDFGLPGGGESLRAFYQRIEGTLRGIALRHPGTTVVAVTHGGVLDCAYRIASGLALAAPRRFDLLNASVNRIAFDGERFSLLGWGDVAHLDSALDDVEARLEV